MKENIFPSVSIRDNIGISKSFILSKLSEFDLSTSISTKGYNIKYTKKDNKENKDNYIIIDFVCVWKSNFIKLRV